MIATRNRAGWILWAALATAVFAFGGARAQDRPKVGVALGGGAAKGFAHIGVLQVLEEVGMPIDYMTGVSMGSIVGGMYAVGYSAAELESIVVHVDWTELFSDRDDQLTLPMEEKRRSSRYITGFRIEGFNVRFRAGLIEGENISRFFSRLTLPYQRTRDFTRFPIPFACVATDIQTGEAVVLREGFLAEAIGASMAIPTIFSPVKIGGRLLVDGGIVRLLPAEDVRDLGADIIIGVDVGKREYSEEELRSFVNVSNQVLNLMLEPALQEQFRVSDILIQPNMVGVTVTDYRDAPEIIERGREAARAILPRLRALADSLNALAAGESMNRSTARGSSQALAVGEWMNRSTAGGPSGAFAAGESMDGPVGGRARHPAAPMDSVYLTDVAVEGLSTISRTVVDEYIGVKAPELVSVRRVNDSVQLIRGSQLFDRVNARIDLDAGDAGIGEGAGDARLGESVEGAGLGEGAGGTGLDEGAENARLVLKLRENTTNLLGLGLRYDTRRDASLLVNATFRRAGLGGATLSIDAIFREEYGLEARYTLPVGFIGAFGARARAGGSRVFLSVVENGERLSMTRTKYYFGELATGTLFSTRLSVDGGLRGEYINYGDDAPARLGREDVLVPVFGEIVFDSIDRWVYPRRGVYARLVGETASDNLGSDATFSRVYLDWRLVVPVGRKVSVLQNLYLGRTFGSDVPPAYAFFLGGMDEKPTLLGESMSFYGLEHQDRVGDHMQTFGVGLQWDALDERYIILMWNVGNTFDEWPSEIVGRRYINGGGITLGIDTILGPIEATAMTSEAHDFLAYFIAGYEF